MPKFTPEELEEIRRNTEKAEEARKKKEEAKQKKKKTKRKKKKKKTESYPLKERLFALVILGASLAVSAVVWFLQN